MKEYEEYNTIIFSKDRTPNKTSKEMWDEISSFLNIAQQQEYVCVIRTEIPDEIIAIDFQHDENSSTPFGCCNPRWVTYEEWDNILTNRCFEEEEEEDRKENQTC